MQLRTHTQTHTEGHSNSLRKSLRGFTNYTYSNQIKLPYLNPCYTDTNHKWSILYTVQPVTKKNTKKLYLHNRCPSSPPPPPPHHQRAMPISPYFQCLTSLPSPTISTYILEPNTICMVCLKCHSFRNILAITVFAIGISNIYGMNLFY